MCHPASTRIELEEDPLSITGPKGVLTFYCSHCEELRNTYAAIHTHLKERHGLDDGLPRYPVDWHDESHKLRMRAETEAKFDGHLKIVDTVADFLLECGL